MNSKLLIIATAAGAAAWFGVQASAGGSCATKASCGEKDACATKASCGEKDACAAKAECCGAEACPHRKAADADHPATIDTAGLKVLLDAKAPAALFDARTGKYDDGRRIPGAKGLPADAPDEDVLAAAGADKGVLLVTYCSNLKCPASGILAGRLRKLGFRNVLEYPAGIEGWEKAGLEVLAPEKPTD